MKEPWVHFSIFSTGLGHAKRDAAIIAELRRRGAFISASASGEAALLIRPLVHLLANSPVLDVGWGSAGDVSIRRTVRQLPMVGPLFARQVAVEARLVSRAHVVVADSKLSPYVPALALQKPLISLWNQLWLASPLSADRQRLSLVEKAFGVFSLLAITRADVVLILDYPPPYTISYLNAVNRLSVRKARFVGPILDGRLIEGEALERAKGELGLGEGEFVLFLSGGPGPSRRRLSAIFAGAAKLLKGKVQAVVVGANPVGRGVPQRTEWGWWFEWCPYVEALMRLSSLVVCRGGHQTLSWCLHLGRPCIVIPISKHSEQISNARRIEALGTGRHLSEAVATPERLAELVIEAHRGPLHERAVELSRRLRDCSGLGAAVEAIMRLAHQG